MKEYLNKLKKGTFFVLDGSRRCTGCPKDLKKDCPNKQVTTTSTISDLNGCLHRHIRYMMRNFILSEEWNNENEG